MMTITTPPPPTALPTTTTTTTTILSKRSSKKRNKATLLSSTTKATSKNKLHVLSDSTTPTGVGTVMASIPNRLLGQGKRSIWIGTDKYHSIILHHRINNNNKDSLVMSSSSSSCPTKERLRAAGLFALKKLFKEECRITNIVPPPLCLERWVQTMEMMVLTTTRPTTTTTNKDTKNQQKTTWNMLVTNNNNCAIQLASETFKNDILRASTNTAEAERIVCKLYDEILQLKQALLKKTANNNNDTKSSVVIVVRHRHTFDISLSDHPRHLLKLNHEHYEKLKTLWTSTHCDNYNVNNRNNNTNNEEQSFHNDLYCLLARYYSIQGPGFQAACPEQVFNVLEENLNVHHECFASPLNCYYGSYCSAYYDVDFPFGSLGSFWDFKPNGGSFQANPPFVHHVMMAMVNKIQTLLSQQHIPFSFVVIVPVWLEEESYQIMCQSPFTVQHWIIHKADHGFCDGAQHQRRDRYRVSPYDTAVLVLQNDAGRSEFPVPSTLEQELRQAFATGVPTMAAMERRKRDGRGDMDEDGGGGVYKGKKRNRTGAGVEQRRSQERASKKKAKKLKNKNQTGQT